jgi:hypothetical protein
LSIKNPKRVKDQKDDWKAAIKKAKQEGYDGIVYRNEAEGKNDSYIAFDPGQLKSADPVTYDDAGKPCAIVASTDLITDCDDSAVGVNPGAAEVCDSGNVDEDCDGLADDADSGAGGRQGWYTDGDSDGYGATASLRQLCDAPPGGLQIGGDCDDGAAAVYPGATEVCDGADNDCDSSIDEGLGTLYYGDSDGDGHGDPGRSQSSCAGSVPVGYVSAADDCDGTEGAK